LDGSTIEPSTPASAASKICARFELACRMLAAVEKCFEFIAFGLAEFDAIGYPSCVPPARWRPDEQLNRMSGVGPSAKTFTPKQGASIHLYPAGIAGRRRKPTFSDIFASLAFRSPDGVDALTLERAGFISGQPGVAHSIEVLINPKLLPELMRSRIQHVTITVTRYSSDVFFVSSTAICSNICRPYTGKRYIMSLDSLRETACVVAPLRRRSSP
jgi:hypothetical protein